MFAIILSLFRSIGQGLRARADNLTRGGIQHGNLLEATVNITAYNYRRSAPFLRTLVNKPQPSLLARRGADDVIESTRELAVGPTALCRRIVERRLVLAVRDPPSAAPALL
jgi:hypothetical protein